MTIENYCSSQFFAYFAYFKMPVSRVMSFYSEPLTFTQRRKVRFIPPLPPFFTAPKPRREVKMTPTQDFFNYVLLKVIPSLGISFVESFLNTGC